MSTSFAAARSFAQGYLRDLYDLQLFIALVAAPDQWWDVRAVARELHVPDGVARAALEHLAGRNLLEIRVTGDIRYRFCPGGEELRQRSLAFVEAFAADPLGMARALSESRGSSARDFADAFTVRRRDR